MLICSLKLKQNPSSREQKNVRELRSHWRVWQGRRGKVGLASWKDYEDLGKMEEAEEYNKEAREGLKVLGKLEKDNLCEADFNILLNYVDS